MGNSIEPNIFSIAALWTSIICLFLVLLFLLYGKTKVHRIWGLFNLSLSLWAFFVFLAASSANKDYAYIFWLISHSFGIFISIFFFHTILQISHSRTKLDRLLLAFSYPYGVIFISLNWIYNGAILYSGTHLLFNSIHYLQVKALPFIFCLSPWIILALASIFKLFGYCAVSKDPLLKNLCASTIIGYFGGASTFLPMFDSDKFYPSTVILVGLYGIVNSYSIFKHHLFEMQIIIKKSIVYSIVLTLVTLIYLLIVFFAEKLFQSIVAYNSLFISTLIVLFIALSFSPLKSRIQYYVDKYFFDRSHLELLEENAFLRQQVTQSKKLKAIATLASGLAHEIKNPLTALSTFSEYLPEKKQDHEFLNKFANIVPKEVKRINDLVHHLLEFARPGPLEMRHTLLHELIEELLTFLNSHFIKNRIRVEKAFYAPRKIQLFLDANRFRQVLLNIIMNAVEAMPYGGLLSVTTEIRSFLAKSDETYVFIIIQDTGMGIAKEDLSHIFNPFYTKKEKGTGLGLSIAYEVVKLHYGVINVESHAGVGTKFIIRLPLKMQNLPTPSPSQTTPS